MKYQQISYALQRNAFPFKKIYEIQVSLHTLLQVQLSTIYFMLIKICFIPIKFPKGELNVHLTKAKEVIILLMTLLLMIIILHAM